MMMISFNLNYNFWEVTIHVQNVTPGRKVGLRYSLPYPFTSIYFYIDFYITSTFTFTSIGSLHGIIKPISRDTSPTLGQVRNGQSLCGLSSTRYEIYDCISRYGKEHLTQGTSTRSNNNRCYVQSQNIELDFSLPLVDKFKGTKAMVILQQREDALFSHGRRLLGWGCNCCGWPCYRWHLINIIKWLERELQANTTCL